MRNNGQDFLMEVKLKGAPSQNEIEFCVFGRGFGECIIIGIGGEYIIVDSFINPTTNRPIALDYLDSIGINYNTIKEVAISHWHTDHIYGISQILEVANQNVKIALTPLVKQEKFNKFISRSEKVGQYSTKEYIKILEFIEKRGKKCIKYIVPDTRIFAKEDDIKTEIFALSPQDIDIADYLSSLILPQVGMVTSYEYPNENHLSVVLLIKYLGGGILSGGDLETVSNSMKGWDAVVSNYSHKKTLSSVFKIPHHGSITGHNELVWKNLLIDKPTSILTTYNKGRRLPSAADIDRIRKLSSKFYIVGAKGPIGRERKAIVSEIKKVANTENVEAVSYNVGMVRWRKDLSNVSEPKIERFGAVEEINCG